MNLEAAPNVHAPDDDSPVIGVLDSGINEHPLLDGAVLARTAFPPMLGEDDKYGHGTKVGGVALFGDLRDGLRNKELRPAGRLVSAKILQDNGGFYEKRTLPQQMREAVTQLHQSYECRIFVISLGDKDMRSESGRVGPWAATLDELVRELDILIFVSAGNRIPRAGEDLEQAITEYPHYLLEHSNQIFEPAGACNVLTVGALANGTGVGAKHARDAHIQPITLPLEPAPFSRSGPRAGKIRKPDFVDIGGTLVFDAASRRLQSAPNLPEAGVITLNHLYQQQILTSARGTSFSAPMLANKAAELLKLLPGASANLLRTLLAGASRVPEPCSQRLKSMEPADKARIHGYGMVDILRAGYSDDHRVVLFAEDSLRIDHFAVYRVPVPPEFQSGGKRTIRVSLAFDPPVRHTRAEYIGIKMNFRLLRGCESEDVIEHFRARSAELEDGDPPNIPERFKCNLDPRPNSRDRHVLQSASQTFTRDTTNYGGEYYLVVRREGGWAESQEVFQNFAVAVELEHQPSIRLYERIRMRTNVAGM